MSKTEGVASEMVRDETELNQVYDFLYHDARRVASFLAQFDPSGALTGIKQSESISEQTGEEGNMEATATALVARAKGSFITRRQSIGGEAAERTYDPLWANACAFLQLIADKDLAVSDIAQARIGQFVLLGGHLMITDLGMLKQAWEQPAIKKIVTAGMQTDSPSSRQQRRGREAAKPQSSEADVVFALLSLMPHSLQARLIGETGRVWCSLAEDAVVGRASDLLLKHGTLIDGTWNILGIFDAYPYDPNYTTDEGQSFGELLAGEVGTPVGQLAVMLGPVTRQLLGRPPNFCGVTPLLIYREVAR